MDPKERFVAIYRQYIRREGAEELLNWLLSTDFSRETEIIEALGHSYSARVTSPTCTAQGYTTHTC